MEQNFIIYGLGISGRAVLSFFAKNQIPAIAVDDNAKNFEKVKKSFLENYPQSRVQFTESKFLDFNQNSFIVVAAGIPIDHPKKHKILNRARDNGAKLICDAELLNLLHHYHLKQIAITGTNGKSTTTALTGYILQLLKVNPKIGGNIGVACLDLIDNLSNLDQTFVLELSSYQLDLIDKSRFEIAALLNITPDHIDHHGSFENYIAAKKKIFQNQRKGDFSVIGIDDELSNKIFLELTADKNFEANLIPFSTKEVVHNGVSLIDGMLYNKISGEDSKFPIKPKFLIGNHNMENIACSFALSFCHLLKQQKEVSPKSQQEIIDAIENFKGLKHRLQIVGKIENINFINDSKATNAESTACALESCENIFWIVGGVTKEGGIKSLKPYFKKITKAYLIGESSEEFAKFFKENQLDFTLCNNLEIAMKKAFNDAKKHSILEKNILLSPACASFDQWKNFEERGDYFCQKFNDLQHS